MLDKVNELKASARDVDTGLIALVAILGFFEIPADAKAIQHKHAPGGGKLDKLALLQAAREKGLKAKAGSSSIARLKKLPTPTVAIAPDGSFFIIAKVGEESVLVKEAGRPASEWSYDTLAENWSNEVIYLTRRAADTAGSLSFGLKWFLPVIARYKKLFTEVLVASFFLQIFALVTPLFSQVIIDKVLVHRGLTTLDVLIIGLAAIAVFEVTLGGLRTYIFSHTTSRVDAQLGAKLFQHLLALPMSYFESRQTGQTVARVRELENIRNFLTSSALTLVIDLGFTVVFFVVMYYYSPTLTYVVLASLPFYIVISLFVTPLLKKRIEEQFERGAVNQAFLVESVSGVETLKAMAVEPQMHQRWEENLAAYVRSSFRTITLGTVGSQSVTLVNKITTGAILWFGAHAVIAGDMTVGALVAFNMLAGHVSGPILRLAQLWQDFQQFRISVDRLADILNTKTETNASATHPNLPPIRGSVKAEHVTFRYKPGTPEVLRDLSLEIKPGQVIGLVGRSGSGKSTLTKLLQRMHVPERGRVLVDGIDIMLLDPGWLRRQIGVVLQENVLFNRTVRDNIALANPSMSMEAVIQAAKLAAAHDFILQLPQGYDTVLEERGSNLSGGQRQRIAIARALATNPRILVFDEATSALDYESEAVIQKNMRDICRGRTVFLVAHRLSTVRRADRILVMDEGQVVEDGPHEKLMKLGGIYADLVKQSAG
ncbi:MAG: type I secretion system permease/ATPase [Alphaproteobacteria bacterium]|nr:type I secretion system permease/ATPase [Alphaproteobacteria bacterium]